MRNCPNNLDILSSLENGFEKFLCCSLINGILTQPFVSRVSTTGADGQGLLPAQPGYQDIVREVHVAGGLY